MVHFAGCSTRARRLSHPRAAPGSADPLLSLGAPKAVSLHGPQRREIWSEGCTGPSSPVEGPLHLGHKRDGSFQPFRKREEGLVLRIWVKMPLKEGLVVSVAVRGG